MNSTLLPKNWIKEDELPDFETLANSIAMCTNVRTFDGIEVNYVKSLSPITNLAFTLSIMPRIYPLEQASLVNEQKQPGNCSFLIISNIKGMPFRFTLTRQLNPNIFLSVPLSPWTDLAINADLFPSGSFSTQIQHHSLNTGFDFSFTAGSYFNKANTILTYAHTFPNNVRFGILGTYHITDKAAMIRIAADRPFKRMRIGGIINFIGLQKQYIVSSISYPIGVDGNMGSTFEGSPNDLSSSFTIGFDKGYLNSRLSSKITSTGILTSLYQRKCGPNLRLLFSGTANLIGQQYSFGIGFTFQ